MDSPVNAAVKVEGRHCHLIRGRRVARLLHDGAVAIAAEQGHFHGRYVEAR